MRFLIGTCAVCQLEVDEAQATFVAGTLNCESCAALWGTKEKPEGADCWLQLEDGNMVSGIIPVAVVQHFYRGEGIPARMPFIPSHPERFEGTKEFVAKGYLVRIA